MSHLIGLLSIIGLCAACASAAVVMPTPATPAAEVTQPPASTLEPTPTLVAPSRAGSAVAVRYAALGDSYTIGTSVRAMRRWPDQLVRALRPDIELELVRNLAVNGATSGDLISEQLPEIEGLDAQLVSVLVGVNDVVRYVPAATYRANVRVILDTLLRTVPADRIFVVSTPDYTLTPRGGDFGERREQRGAIQRFNELIAAEASARGIVYIDISPVSDRVPDDESLVAQDGLHPSGKQYAGWVELIAPAVRRMLTGE